MKHFVSGVTCGVVAVTFCLFLLTSREGHSPVAPTSPAAVGEGIGADVRRELGAIADRLALLEARVASGAEVSVRVTPPTKGGGGASVLSDQRIAALEQELNDLHRQFSMVVLEPQLSGEAGIDQQRLLAVIRTQAVGENMLASATRIPFAFLYLEQWPESPEARSVLEELVSDYRLTCQPGKAVAAVERFGPRMNLAAEELNKLRLKAEYRPGSRVEIARRVLATATDPDLRAEAWCAMAKGLAASGRPREALETIQACVGQLVGTYNHRGWVHQMEQLQASLLAGR